MADRCRCGLPMINATWCSGGHHTSADPVVPVTDAERLSDKLNDVRDVLTGFYGLAGEDDTAEKRLLRIAQILSVERSHYPAVGDEKGRNDDE